MQQVRVDRRTVASREYLPGEFILVHRPSNQTTRLQGTGAVLWRLLLQGMDITEIIGYMHDYLNVDEAAAANDVSVFIQGLYRRGFLLIDGKPQVAVPVRSKLDMPADFMAQVMRNRIPYSGILELTRTCHLRCTHCYHPVHADDSRLSTDEWKRVLAELASAGTCTLTLTGGEVFLRADAIDLIEEATDLGFLVDVLTTGTTLNPEIIERLVPLHLSSVCLSVYGSNPRIHDAITQLPGSFEQVVVAAEALRAASLRVVLSFMITKQSFADRSAVQALAARLGVSLQIDFKLFPRHNCDPSPLELRLEQQQVLELISEGLVDYPEGEGVCLAGVGKFSITPEGAVKVCQVFPYPSGNLKHNSFEAIWRGPRTTHLVKQFHQSLPEGCTSCSSKQTCYRCPAMSLLEFGDATKIHPYYCSLTKAVIENALPGHGLRRALLR